jgi:glucosylglycerate synthase
LADEALLNDDFLRQLMNVGEVDILVGLPTYNNAKTVETVVRALQAGILKCFPRERVVIINVDGGSQDGTPSLVTSASIDDVWRASKVYALRTLHVITTQYGSSSESGIALRTILSAADLLRARACVLISPDASTIDAEWLQRLVRPIYNDDYDLVSPLYRRQKFAGVLMRNLLYPMTRAIYGKNIREPYPSEFAISSRLATDFLSKENWGDEGVRNGAEILLTVMAISGNYRLCQSFLGDKPPQDRSATDLVEAIRRTVGTLFFSLGSNFKVWSTISSYEPVTTFGAESAVTLDGVEVDVTRMREMFVTGVAELEPLFKSILSETTLLELQRIAALEVDAFRYPPNLWARTAFEFAASYHKAVISRDHIVQALVPLYRGRALSFLLENRDATADGMEKDVESLCGEFERSKPYLLELWADRK